MQYRHAPAANHAPLDAVLVSAPGRPTLPVRPTVELLGRARAHLPPGPVTVWDPCCGAGATLTVLGLLCAGITRLVGTDADPAPLDLARRNLTLLDDGGLAARAAELDDLARRHGKPSYAGAAAAARSLRPRSTPTWTVTAADAFDPAATAAALDGPAPGSTPPGVVLADLPHGRQTSWSRGAGPGAGPGADPVAAFLTAVAAAVPPATVLVAVDRARSVALPPGTRVLERLRIGHRAAVLLTAGALHPG